jgi:hypothetical protein
MEMLKFWEKNSENRKSSFLHSRTHEGGWICTLVIHDDGEAHFYTTATTQFIGTPFNTKEHSSKIVISMFVLDVCS